MRRLLLGLGTLVLLLALALPAALWWLLASAAGNQLMITRLAPLLGISLRVGARSGSLTGPLEWRDIAYEDRFVQVRAQRLSLHWKPQRLWDGLVDVQDLDVDGLAVHLKPDPSPPSPSSSSSTPTRLPVNIDLQHLAISRVEYWAAGADEPLVVDRIDFAGRWIGAHVEVQHLQADYAPVGPIALQADTVLDTDGIRVAHLGVQGPLQLVVQGFAGYRSESDLQLAWTDLQWPLPGTAAAAPPATVSVSSHQGHARLQGTWQDIGFSVDAELGAKGHLLSQGRWNGRADLKAQWTDLSWPMGVAPPVADGPPAAYRSARGSLAFQGLPTDYAFDLDADLVAQQQAGHVAARGSGTEQSVDLEVLKLLVGKGSLQAAGKLAWAPQPSGALKGSVAHLDPGVWVAGWPGDLNGEFDVDGALTVPGPSAPADPALNFTVRLHDSQLRGFPLQLDSAGRFARNILSVARLELRSGQSLLTASGRATAPYDLQAQLASTHMAELAPGLGGSIQAKAHFRGTLKTPVLDAQATLAGAVWQDYVAGNLEVAANLDGNGALRLDLAGRDLMVGTLLDAVNVHVVGTRPDHTVTLNVAAHGSSADLALAGGWDEERQRWQGQITGSHVTPAGFPVWTLSEASPLLISATQDDLGPACWIQDPGRVCLEAHRTPALTRAQIKLDQLALAEFRPLLPDTLVLTGELNGHASVELAGGVLRQAQAELDSTAGSMQLGDREFKFLPAHLTVSDTPEQGQAELNLPLEVGGIQGEAHLAPGDVLNQRALSGELRLDFPDLAFLSVLSNEITSASGKLSGQYRIGGRLAQPDFQGEARLTDGHMKLSRPGIDLTDVNAVVTGSSDGSVHMTATAKSGGGSLNVDGEIQTTPLAVEPVSGSAAPNARHKPDADPVAAAAADVAAKAAPVEKANANAPTHLAGGAVATPSSQPPPPEVLPTENSQGLKLVVQVDGSDFQIADLPQAQVWASPSLRFTLSGKEASLKGGLIIPRAEIRLQQGQDSGVAPSSDQVIVDASGKAPERAQTFSLATEVKLQLGEKVNLEGYGLKTRLEGVITAVDQPGRDTLGYGELHLEDGRYTAYGQDLAIETGKLLFNGGPIAKPGLEIRASRKETDDVTVGLYVRGTLEKPELSLFSTPAMTQQEQLSWLLFSQPLQQSSTNTQDRGALGSAAVALGLGGGTLLAQNFQKGLRLDSITMGSDPGETSEQARLTVGKYLSPKIFVSYGVGLFQPGQVFKLLYDLGRGFKLSTESGTATGGDLLYQVERP